MTREWAIQFAALYGPLFSAALLALILRPRKPLATGLLFATAWNAALLPWLDVIAQFNGLWSYHFEGPGIAEMPLSLYFGWIITWGIVAPLLTHALAGRWWLTAAILVIIDLRAMPEMHPLLSLHPHWWLGELMMFATLLIPSLLLAHWTSLRVRTPLRAAMLVPCFGGIILGLPLLLLPSSNQALPVYLVPAFFLALPGLTAVRDLALGGDGTPVPLDPPRRLVTHGIYGFISNPMQLSMSALLALEAAYLRNPWPLALAAIGILYSEGFARWSEGHDMTTRFGKSWQDYRRKVRPWLPSWRPAATTDPCELWVDLDCSHCLPIARWFSKRQPTNLAIHHARDWPGKPLTRITWHHPASGRRESGIRAIAMALQHLTLPWAALGWILSTPGISPILQACLDASGAGQRPAASARNNSQPSP